MRPLFVSYSRVDSGFALRLVRDLKERQVPTWFDQLDIGPGLNWDEEIERALSEADVVLLILSQHSVSSENVKNEISHALELKKQVVPIVLGKSAVPLMITRLQREDFTGDYSEALNKLVLRLRGASRTEALQAISLEHVTRLSNSSAERLGIVASVDDTQVRSGAAAGVEGRDAAARGSSESLSVTHVSVNPPRASSPGRALGSSRSRRMIGWAAAGLAAAAIGTLATLQLGTNDAPSVAADAPPVGNAVASLQPLPAPTPSAAPDTPSAAPEANGAPRASASGQAASLGSTTNETGSTLSAPAANIAGTWLSNEGDVLVSQRGAELVVSRPNRPQAKGTVDGSTLRVNFPDRPGCCSGHLVGQFIQWSNNQYWRNSRDPKLK